MSTNGKVTRPGVPSWLESASEDDPIYKRGLVFGGTYSINSSKSTPETTSQESKEPLTIEEAYEEAALRAMKVLEQRYQAKK